MSELRIGSLCSGAGMLDEGVRSVLGGEIAWHAEWEPATEKNPNPRQSALRVLMHRYPGVESLGDLTTVDWRAVDPIDVLTAGYPCQPDSAAGKRLSEDDHRWIFPDVARAIGVLRPRLVVLENVQGHFVRGFRTVLGSLADLGFDADWTLVRASDVGAPHRRERLFVVAWPAGDADGATRGQRWITAPGEAAGRWARSDAGGSDRVRVVADADRDALRVESVGELGRGGSPVAGHAGPVAATDPACSCGANQPVGRRPAGQHERPVTGASGDVGGTATVMATPADTYGDGLQGVGRLEPVGRDADRCGGSDTAWGRYEPAIRRWEHALGRPAPAPTEAGTRGGQRLSPRFVEWMMGWPAGWVTDVPGISRNDALRICGNGVVPQQAAEALRRLLSLEQAAA